ncbi:lysophospholipid acyltransferase family protein [Pseudonocardia eucalypti]|uniref:Lysophospholipid acyltransferase family protein n=1 Tax=Pseudonocardia eucalypti TaxID=648755 RepID=A0ABP9REG0_9PSEU|nr:1-acyl-sn-glycerol-3-phosphate acyltransferase [Pseudonocardia eucalypti]
MADIDRQLPADSWPVLHDLARWLATWLFRPAFRLRLYNAANVPASGPVVLVANHSSLLDGPLLLGIPRRRSVFLIKVEMFTGVRGWFLHRIGQLAVRRDVPDRAPLLAAQALLRAGGLVAVFPEGTRGDGDSASARGGAAWLARSTGAVVVPVACRGTRRPEDAGRRFRPRVDILVGEPFQVSTERGRAGLATATEQVRSALADLVAEVDELRGIVK